ncbi:MAG: hypothetical protein MSH32_08305 [Lachnospiraceae bacterium]|nr:hypothetical protein [Lachnospiraceae bacterium]
MSKALKVIVGIILALFIASGAALIIPSFVGYDMRVVQQQTTGNIPVGSAVYSKEYDSTSISVGDKILGIGTDSLNIYTVEKYSATDGTVLVTDGTNNQTFQVSAKYLKVIFTIPLIGFLMIATQSTTGIIALALILALVVFLFIAAEIIRKGEEEEEEDEEEEPEEDEFYRTLAARKKKRDAETDVSAELNRNAAHRQAAQMKEREREKNAGAENKAASSASANTNGMTEISGSDVSASIDVPHVVPEEKDLGTDSLPDVQAALEAALESQPLNRTGETARMTIPDEDVLSDAEASGSAPTGEIELAMPVHTADELLSKAYSDGLDPKVRDDEITGVTLVDYSDCL